MVKSKNKVKRTKRVCSHKRVQRTSKRTRRSFLKKKKKKNRNRKTQKRKRILRGGMEIRTSGEIKTDILNEGNEISTLIAKYESLKQDLETSTGGVQLPPLRFWRSAPMGKPREYEWGVLSGLEQQIITRRETLNKLKNELNEIEGPVLSRQTVGNQTVIQNLTKPRTVGGGAGDTFNELSPDQKVIRQRFEQRNLFRNVQH